MQNSNALREMLYKTLHLIQADVYTQQKGNSATYVTPFSSSVFTRLAKCPAEIGGGVSIHGAWQCIVFLASE